MDPSNPFLKYPEEIKSQRLQGVLGYTKHDILYANMDKPVVIDVPSNSTKPLESAVTSPEGNTLLKVVELELSEVESSCDESLESSESDKDIENDLIDSDCEKEIPDKFTRLKRMVAREPLLELVGSDTNTKGRGKLKGKQAGVVDLTGESDDELEAAAVNEITDLVGKIMIQSSDDGDEESENFHANATTPITLKSPNRKFCEDVLKSAAELLRFDSLSSGVPSSQRPMTPRMVKEYDEAIALGQMLESREEHLVATKHYLAALSICDVDVELHRKLFNLKSKLETAAVLSGGRSFS